MAALTRLDVTRILGQIRWTHDGPTLLGRKLQLGAQVQVLVELDVKGEQVGTWMDAEVSAIDAAGVELRTSFARFHMEPSALCRWPASAPTLTRRELGLCFAATSSDVISELQQLVARFENDPQLRKVPQDQLAAYGRALESCGERISAVASLMNNVAQDLAVAADGSLLVVGQLSEPPSARARVR